MIFKKSLIRELTITAAALFTVSLAIVFTQQVIRQLSRAVGGQLAADGIFPVLGFYALQYLPILLQITLFLTVLLVLSRAYRDNEMVVWSSSGVPMTNWIYPILSFAAPFLFAVLLLSLFLTPWAQQQRRQYEQQLETRDEITMLAPGLFREFKRAGLVFFVESLNPLTGKIENVFVQSIDKPRVQTITANSGFLEKRADGERYIVAENGSLYEGIPGTADYRIIEFSQLGHRIKPAETELVKPSIRAMSTFALISNFQNAPERAELFGRVSLPLAALFLTLLAIPLSYVNPRMGRSFNLIAAVLIYLLYTNGTGIIQGLIAHDRVPFWLALILPHGLVALGAWLLFLKRTHVSGLRFLRERKTAVAASDDKGRS
jgi:lipopolysaccharide export system permease protein